MSATAAHPFPTGVTSFTGAQANDQYVAKHFPFPWFHSLTGTRTRPATTTPGLTKPVQGGTDCDANAHRQPRQRDDRACSTTCRSESTTPAFSWITPNNCSDAHDAICKGNNLSGSFTSTGAPIYQSPTPNPESTTPKNFTGGLYASDLFLEYYIPMIEKSAAFKDGGLIDITFDEGNPPFTYSGNSFNNANAYGPTLRRPAERVRRHRRPTRAGENIFGKNVHSEPTGPNSTLQTDAQRQPALPGPGDNAFIDRPPACTPTTPTRCRPTACRASCAAAPATPRAPAPTRPRPARVLDLRARPTIVADRHRPQVTDTVDTTGPGGTSPIPANTFVGTVSDTGPQFADAATGSVIDGSFQLVDQTGKPVTPTGAVSGITLSAEGAPGLPRSRPDAPTRCTTRPTRPPAAATPAAC